MAYARTRLSGLKEIDSPVRFRTATRDSIEFAGAYEDLKIMHAARSGALVAKRIARPKALVCAGPIKYVGQDELQVDIDNLKSGAQGRHGTRTSSSPRYRPRTSNSITRTEYYSSDEEYLAALVGGDARGIPGDRRGRLRAADRRSAHGHALQPRHRATIEDCRKFIALRVEALNHALRGIPRTRSASTPATAPTSRRACTISS